MKYSFRPTFLGSAGSLLAIALGLTFLAITPADAQDLNRQRLFCTNQSGSYTLAVQIRACTTVIETGSQTYEHIASAFNSRGNAYRAQNDYARAIADYNDAIRVNPRYA